MDDQITPEDGTLDLNFPECLRADFPFELPLAIDAVQSVLEAVAGRSFGALAVHSPALAEFDWANYLTCSIARMVHVLGALRRRGVSGRVLDYGSYFGNFSIMLRAAGFEVDAIDSYATYGESLSRSAALLRRSGIRVLDFGDIGRDLHRMPGDTYDVVLFLGVVEHIPHTPRSTLLSIDRVLKPGGHLVIDTPSHSYLYNRQRLARGESVMASIDAQFNTPDLFEGHHREYTPSEVVWMLRQIGHTDASVEMFNYSEYGLPVVERRDLSNHWDMVLDPSMREVIMTVSRKRSEVSGTPIPDDWRDAFQETETYWTGRALTDSVARNYELLVNSELLLGKLDHRVNDLEATVHHMQQEINRRDAMLREQEQQLQREIQLRDQLIRELHAKLDYTLSARLGRVIRNLKKQ